MILLDTMVAVWIGQGDRRLGAGARRLIGEAVEEQGLGIAAITPWEIAMLSAKERLMLGRPVVDWVSSFLSLSNVELVPLSIETGAEAGSLSRDKVHADPADRIVMATARFLNCPVLTSDGLILGYAAAGLVTAIDARR